MAEATKVTQTLNKFYQAAQDYGFSRDFQARITGLVINGNSFSTKEQDPEKPFLYIKNFSLPSAKKIVSTVKYHGVDIHSVGPRTFGDSTNWRVTFYSDQNLLIRQWLLARMVEAADNEEDRINYNPVPGLDSYATIDVVNDNLYSVIQYKLEGLFIVDVPGSDYNLAGAGSVQELTVTFGYQRWTSKPFDAEGHSTNSPVSTMPSIPKDKPETGPLSALIGGLKGIANVANAVAGTANAVRNVGTSVRGAGRAIRGR